MSSVPYREVASKQARVEKLKKENESLERDVERFQEREKLKQEADDMRKKMPWLEFEKAKSKWSNAKAELQACRQLIKDKDKQLEQYKKPLDRAKQEHAAAQTREKEMRRERRRLDEKRSSLTEGLDKLYNESDQKLKELDAARRRAMDHRRKVAQREEKLRDAQAALAEAPEPPDNSAELTELKEQINKKNLEVLSSERKVDELNRNAIGPERALANAERRLRDIDSVRGQKISVLAKNNPGITDGDRWVSEHQNLFHKPVLGPILTLIECDDKDHQNYLQMTCKDFLFSAYITQDIRDRDTLNSKFKELRLSAINVSNVTYREPDISHLHAKGITHRLDQTFRAEPVVKQVLVDGASIDRAYVARRDMAGEQIEHVLKTTEVARVFTPSTIFNKTKSRYSTDINLNSADVRPSRLFTVGTNAGERSSIVEQIRGLKDDKATIARQLHEASTRKTGLEQELKNLTSRRNLLSQKGRDVMQERDRLQSAVNTARMMLDKERNMEDLDAIEARYSAELTAVTKKREATAIDLADIMTSLFRSAHEVDAQELHRIELHAQMQYLTEEFNRQTEQSSSLRAELDSLTKTVQATKERAREKKAIAERDAPLTEELMQKFNEMPVLVEELEEAIRLIEDEADAILCPNGMVLEDYKRRKAEIDDLVLSLRTEEEELANAQGEIGSLKDRWLPKLRDLVAHVNENFKANFAAIGCAGEVKLNEDAGERFEAWRLEIWVKFRAATDMHILDAHRQSGGERSVSTMLYLISLQELTRAPFRVVDEINQGMDPINERKIFKRMTNAASKESTPQTFLLTPKLLNNLQYTEDCTVLCIFNGPWIEEVAKRWREIQHALQPIVAGPDTP